MVDDVIAAEGLTKSFGARAALSDVSLRVRRARAFGLLGPNGSGKTTTVRLLNGLLSPTSGSITLFGERLNLESADRLRSRIGVQTDTNVYENLTVRENLRTWGALHGLSGATARRRTDEILEMMSLTERASSLAGELSKGMRQKLAVGRAIVHEPELLFLDEPTAGLDPETSLDLIERLREMIRTLRTTLVICTHQLHGLEALCEDVGFLVHGTMRATGEVETLLRRRWPLPRTTVTLGAPRARAAVALVEERVPGTRATWDGDARLTLTLSGEEVVERVVATLVGAGFPLRAVTPETPTIQDLYFDVVGAATGERVPGHETEGGEPS